MPCYNAGKYIKEAIESVVNQTYTDWELIIIDDGSTDNSWKVIQEIVNKHIISGDARIRGIHQSNYGACHARNVGINIAHGEFIKFLDADDMLYPDALQSQIQQIKKLENNQIPFGDYDNIDEKGNVISSFVFTQHSLLKQDSVAFFFSEWRVLISCPLHRTRILRDVGGFNESLMRGQEFDLHLRLALADVQWIHFSGKQFMYREYDAPHRISCGSRKKSHTMLMFREQRMMNCEQLFLKKYKSIPLQYRTYFRDGWFDKARREFDSLSVILGEKSLTHSVFYKPMSRFQNLYIAFGKIIGYITLERILRIRLKILGK